MKYGLNLDGDNRILSIFELLPERNYIDIITVDNLPDGDFNNYLYINNEYVYDELPVAELEVIPTQLDMIEAQVTYTAMMTDTLLEV